MSQTISAHFDGETIVPHDPISLPVGQELRVTLEPITNEKSAPPAPSERTGPFSNLREFAADLKDAPRDLSRRHDYYFDGQKDS